MKLQNSIEFETYLPAYFGKSTCRSITDERMAIEFSQKPDLRAGEKFSPPKTS